MRHQWPCLLFVAAIGACSDPPAVLDDGSVDAGSIDADERADAVAAIDAPEGTDAPAGPDGETPPDGDGDGIAASVDCDDADPAIGRSSTRSCTGACAPGTESCTDGTWGACSAPADCACATPGMMRTVACGRCGMASQRCGSDMRWEMPSECFGERECFAGAIERDLAMCGELARLCDGSCMWLPWETRTPPGECEAGDADRVPEGCPSGQTQPRSCSSACEWMLTGSCGVFCSRPAATSATGADQVCIPEGRSWIGHDKVLFPTFREFEFSEYYIDRTPVTRARYEMCRAAGACPAPTNATLYGSLGDDFAVAGLSHAAADAFCAWDGGRLPSEWQWERAGRGPSPDRRPHTWGTFRGWCAHHPDDACPSRIYSITAFPMAVSPFSVRLVGVGLEHTRTRWSTQPLADYPARDPDDPITPMPGYVVRGFYWGAMRGTYDSLNVTRYSDDAEEATFRCVY